MAYQSFQMPAFGTWASMDATALDASADAVAGIFVAPEAGTITQVWSNCQSIASPPTYRFGIEGVVATDSPSGTYLASGNAYVDAVPSAGAAWRTLGSSVTVAQGDEIALTIRYQSGTIGASNRATFNRSVGSYNLVNFTTFATENTTGSWSTIGNAAPNFAFRYSSGKVVGFPVSSVTSEGWSNADTPLLRGNLFIPPANCKIEGIVTFARITNSGAEAAIELYDGTTRLDFVTHKEATSAPFASPGLIYWPLSKTLNSGSSYRFVVRAASSAFITTYLRHAFPGGDEAEAMGFQNLTMTTAVTSGGSWTNTANSMYCIWPVISEVDVGGGSGGVPLIGPGGLVY